MRMHFDMARIYHQPFKVWFTNKDFKKFFLKCVVNKIVL